VNPYPGLRPFRADEASLFTGRELAAELIATRLRLSPLTLLFARSGVGKSSFLTCRLIPLLAAASNVEYLNEWGSARPAAAVEQRLQALLASPRQTGERPVLILDQFEDVFKLPDSRDDLWDLLAGLVNVHDTPVSLLISVREEWLGAWEEATDYLPDALGSLVRLAPLTDSELTQAVFRPAALEGSLVVAPDLLPPLLADLRRPNAYGLGGAYVEPGMLQAVCRRLWEEAERTGRRTMDAALYQQLGRAAQIEREFVWRDLGEGGRAGAPFSPTERVVRVGLTRYLTAAPDVKAIVDAAGLARRLHLRDLGAAGPAVAAASVSRRSRRYLRASPERRCDPPADLVALIERVLRKGAERGFLKRQQGSAPPVDARGAATVAGPRYELAHDALAGLIQQFAGEFQGWMRSRTVWLYAGLVALLIILPLFIITWHAHGPRSALESLLFDALLVSIVWGLRRLFALVVEAIVYPLVRRLAGGRIPLEREPGGPPDPARRGGGE
jgi:hypothetical protein